MADEAQMTVSAAIDAAALALDYEECVSMQTRRESAARAVAAFLRALPTQPVAISAAHVAFWSHTAAAHVATAVEEAARAE